MRGPAKHDGKSDYRRDIAADATEGLGCDVEIGGDVGEVDAAGDLGLEFEEEAISVGRVHAVEAVGEFNLVAEGLQGGLVDGGFEPGYLLIECEEGVFGDEENGGVAGRPDAGVGDRSVVEALEDGAEPEGLEKIVGDLYRNERVVYSRKYLNFRANRNICR